MITIISFILISGISTYFIYKAYTLAGLSADQDEYIKELEDMSQYMYDQINNVYTTMKKIDSRGAFEKDDETGTVFDQLNQVITNLQEEFNAKEEEKK